MSELKQRIIVQWGDLLDFFKFGVADGADVDGTDTRILGELDVSQGVSNHNGVGEINIGEVPLCLESHARLGFAAVTTLRGKVGATVNLVKSNITSDQLLLHPIVHVVYRRHRT